MLDQAFFKRHVDEITIHVKNVKKEIASFKEPDPTFLETYGLKDVLPEKTWSLLAKLPTASLMSAADETSSLVEELRERLSRLEREELQRLAVLALNSVTLLEVEFELLDEKVTRHISFVAPMLQSVWNRIKGIVAKAIKAISSHLWQIISTALTLKEWSVKGSLSSGIFGLASVEMSLTFGK